MKKIQIINGPNLNLLGKREPTVYGNASFEDYLSELRARFPQCEISYYQSMHNSKPSIPGIIMSSKIRS